MKHKLTTTDIKHLADLIKIHLKADELESYASQLNSVLEAIDVLNEIETKDIKPAAQTHGLQNMLAEDTIETGLNMNDYQNLKNFKSPYFVVNKVI